MRLLNLIYVLLCLMMNHPTSGWVLWSDENRTLGPGVRSGHSFMYFNDSLFIFGGRAREKRQMLHDPKTFSTNRSEEGIVEFTAYNDKHVTACLDANNEQIENVSSPEYRRCYEITVSEYRNDLWVYNVNCTRSGDAACVSTAPNMTDWKHGGWRSIMPGAPLGGCINYNESQVCTHPLERMDHVGEILTESEPAPDPTTGDLSRPDAHVVVYGGYSQMCGDFCSDIWAFPLSACAADARKCLWKEIGDMGVRGPGKRWRAAHTTAGSSRMVIFGGARMWHGFDAKNSLRNNWDIVSDGSSDKPQPDTLPFGGFLDDMWVYTFDAEGAWGTLYNGTTASGYGQATRGGAFPDQQRSRELSMGEPVRPTKCRNNVNGECTKRGAWQQVLPREQCHATPGREWERRNDISCTIQWPPRRASAALAASGEDIYLHGGYAAAAFPYPHVRGRGWGSGTAADAQDSTAIAGVPPQPAQSMFLSDLWHFSWVTGLWTELSHRVPPTEASPEGRRGHTLVIAASKLLILFGGFSSNSLRNDFWWFNITAARWLSKSVFPYPLFADSCTSDVTGPNEAFTGVTSVSLEATRGRALTDGKFGRSSVPVFVRQARRRALGWDGCRDRFDGRADLGVVLSYKQPAQRYGHGAVWSSSASIMFVFGGETLPAEQLIGTETTWPSEAAGDLWTWQANACPLNCSAHGSCVWGFCHCSDGYFGADCSNMTCPGTYCEYDGFSHEQKCTHCCAADYVHTDADVYVQGIRKSPCDATHPGESNGECNGFGQCVCAPPFLGDDCSIKNCPNDCTDPSRGSCILEYPVSRCECKWPYTGDSCQEVLCLNNCSYPNGDCNQTTGECTCHEIVSPYKKQVSWERYHGDDCSYVPAFAGASARGPTGFAHLLLAGAVVVATVMLVRFGA
jgi:hypothetical protein